MKIQVINKKNNEYLRNTVYIGRGSILGNKFILGKDGTRVEVIDKYRDWLDDEMRRGKKVAKEVYRILRKAQNVKVLYLECYCAPKPCHGDVLRDVLAGLDDTVLLHRGKDR